MAAPIAVTLQRRLASLARAAQGNRPGPSGAALPSRLPLVDSTSRRGVAASVGNRSAGEPAALGLERLGRYLHECVAKGQLASAGVLVTKDGVPAYEAYVGDHSPGVAASASTVWRVHSISKVVTSVAMLKLVEEGRCSLSDPLHHYLPRFHPDRLTVYRSGGPGAAMELEPCQNGVTILDLMRHTSGISYGFDEIGDTVPVDPKFAGARLTLQRLDKDGREGRTLASVVDDIADMPLLHHPGQRWTYGFSTDVVGRLIEVVGGQSLDRYLDEHIFQPIGMHSTGFTLSADRRSCMASLYFPKRGGGYRDVSDHDQYHPDSTTLFLGGSGLLSTTGDMATFGQMLLNGGSLGGRSILSRETTQMMLANALPGGQNIRDIATPSVVQPPDHGTGFGLGVEVVTDRRQRRVPAVSNGRCGWYGAGMCLLLLDPARNMSMVFHTQLLFPDPRTFPLHDTLETLLYESLAEGDGSPQP